MTCNLVNAESSARKGTSIENATIYYFLDFFSFFSFFSILESFSLVLESAVDLTIFSVASTFSAFFSFFSFDCFFFFFGTSAINSSSLADLLLLGDCTSTVSASLRFSV